MPNAIYVGGLTMDQPEPLDSKWEQLISTERANTHGVVVFSLGTIAKTETMPMAMKEAFLAAFKRLPHQVIWRVEGQLPDMVDASNVHVTDWIPQKDLLGSFHIVAQRQ
jgi:glucuronosyltransferase